MSGAPEYPIATLIQMAAIPVDAEPRFLAELPSILSEIRRLNEMSAAFEQVGLKIDLAAAGDPTWTDDDKGLATISMALPDGEKIVIERKMQGDPA